MLIIEKFLSWIEVAILHAHWAYLELEASI